MIATIVCSISIAICICVIIYYAKVHDDAPPVFIWITTASTILTLFLSLFAGYSKPNQEEIIETERYEYMLENGKIDTELVKDIFEHNRSVEIGNNLWCRFTIEDRGEYIIDLDEYLVQSEETNNESNT